MEGLSDPKPPATKPHTTRGDRSPLTLLSNRLPASSHTNEAPRLRACPGGVTHGPELPAAHAPGPHAPDEAEVHAQGPVDAGAVDAEEDPVGDAGPARVLGTAVEARLKRRQRNGRAEAAAAALPLLHPPPQPGGPVSRCPAALPRSPPTRPPHRRSAARSPAAPSPSPARGRSEAAPLGKAGGRPAPPGYLIRRRCPEPLEESLNLRLARLRRHVLSFPDTTAATGAGRAQSAQGVGPQYGCRLSPHRAADGPPRGSAPTCPVAMTTGGGEGARRGAAPPLTAPTATAVHREGAQGRPRRPGWAFRVRVPPRRLALAQPSHRPLLRPVGPAASRVSRHRPLQTAS